MENIFLSSSQLNHFSTEGYVKVDDFIPSYLLEKLRNFFEVEMSLDGDISKKAYHIKNGKNYFTNLDTICNNKDLSCLEVLGYPAILQIAQQICGDDFFMIQEFAVMKNLGDDLPVLWHLDMAHGRKGKCFTMGIYLDDADEGDGALRIVPQSHVSNKTICDLSKEPSIEIPMKARGVLIHDMMLAHSSAPLVKNNIRRVIYFEFLSAAHVKVENIYTDELVNRRTRLLFAATKHYKTTHPASQQFELNKEDIFGDVDKTVEEILQEVYASQINARPSTYCFE
jgi:ectoine hydroxylase-related dioxygenase (phytanoyl-CoA dioxygenase family)